MDRARSRDSTRLLAGAPSSSRGPHSAQGHKGRAARGRLLADGRRWVYRGTDTQGGGVIVAVALAARSGTGDESGDAAEIGARADDVTHPVLVRLEARQRVARVEPNRGGRDAALGVLALVLPRHAAEGSEHPDAAGGLPAEAR